VKLESFNSNKL